MRFYFGARTPEGEAKVYVEEAGERRPLPHIVAHSPTGFDWGYNGSGPADLSLALVADVLRENTTARLPAEVFERYCSEHQGHISALRAWKVCEQFKRRVVSHLASGMKADVLPSEVWRLDEADIRQAIDEILSPAQQQDLCPHCWGEVITYAEGVACLDEWCPSMLAWELSEAAQTSGGRA
ncbi:MAG: DUF6166 domain-containing protein [bacterium]|nr:DUF6166 domain-containing protein [bacterium]